MATVAIWKVKSRLDHVLDYAINNEKTDVNKYSDLENSLHYIMNNSKTEQKMFVSSINCDVESAYKDMIRTKKRFCKESGILAFHSYHSFAPGEVTPTLAHEIGLKVANEMWGDRFEVVVSTHLNTKCLHNHFVINSVSFIDGKRYYDNHTSYAELRKVSNDICSEYGLSTLEEKITRTGINYELFQNKSTQFSNYYKIGKRDLDIAINLAHSYEEFLNILNNLGYDVINRAGKLSIRRYDYKRNIRIERKFGIDYTVENIKKQIQGLYMPISKNYFYKAKPPLNFREILLKSKYKSFYGTYLRYSNILNNFSNYIKSNRTNEIIKNDLKQLDKINFQATFLVKNNIETENDFNNFYNGKYNEFVKLKKMCQKFLKNKKKNNEKINIIKNKIIEIKNELNLCEEIRIRKKSIEKSLEFIERKESINYEYIK